MSAVESAFGADIDYAMLHKIYASPAEVENERRYKPRRVHRYRPTTGAGQPRPEQGIDVVCGAANLSMRMDMRPFTRLTNGFSEKVENLAAAVSLHYMHYNFARPHQTLTQKKGGKKTTPAMAVGVTNRVWTPRDIAALLD